MDISSMMAGINPEMLKDLTPEKIEDALKNLPPQMKDMMHSMGTSQHSNNRFTKHPDNRCIFNNC